LATSNEQKGGIMSRQKVFAVTGGASGIGLAVVQRMHADGHLVVSLDLPDKTHTPALKTLGVLTLSVDVLDEVSVRGALAAIITAYGAIDGLVNSAGVIQKRQDPDQLAMKDWDTVVNTNMRGTYLCCAVFGSHMVEQKGGSIVNIASVTSTNGVPLHAYAPAKAAVVSITQCLAGQWGHAGVRVNAVAPGYTETPALQAAIDRGDRDRALLVRQAALGRMVQTNEVANGIAFLLSNQASAITGVCLPIDCGWLASVGWETYGGLPHTKLGTA
jgi:NAD(P)-dependent dehydrogenase (short-subunit alcohol dehydrogenase family)